jgi:hypothetical protein
MSRLRTKPAKPGTCLIEGCRASASGDQVIRRGCESADALCRKHRAAREIEMRERTARGEVAQVLRMADYHRDPDTRAGSVWKNS